MSAVPAAPASAARQRGILTFLKDARCSMCAVEAKLFKYDSFYKRMPIAAPRWEPSGDLTRAAQEIAKYISDNGSLEARLVATDEVYRACAPQPDVRPPRRQSSPTRRVASHSHLRSRRAPPVTPHQTSCIWKCHKGGWPDAGSGCERPTVRRWLVVGGFLMLALASTGCPALILGSILGGGSAGYAGYEYENSVTALKSQPSAMPTPSLNDIE